MQRMRSQRHRPRPRPPPRALAFPWDEAMLSAFTVTIIDDEAEIRSTLSHMVRAEGLPCVTFGSAEAFLMAAGQGAGCVVADLHLPDMDGLTLVRTMEARRLHQPVLVMTGRADIEVAVQAMKEGAVDFLAKPFDRATFIEKIRASLIVHRARLAQHARRTEAERRLASLSGREAQVLGLVIEGLQNKAIAWQLGISIKTVEVHRARIMEKMAAPSVIALVRLWEAAHRDAGVHPASGAIFASAMTAREAVPNWGRP